MRGLGFGFQLSQFLFLSLDTLGNLGDPLFEYRSKLGKFNDVLPYIGKICFVCFDNIFSFSDLICFICELLLRSLQNEHS